jgi:hypothetical protein
MKHVQVKNQKYEEKSCNVFFSNESTFATFKIHDKTTFTTSSDDKNNLTPIISHHPFSESLRFRVHLEARLLTKQVMYIMQPRSLSFQTLLRFNLGLFN